jgi:hypothetical protein
MEGLKAALARGHKAGHRRKLTSDDEAVVRAMLKDPTIPVAAITKRLGGSCATFYAYLPGAPPCCHVPASPPAGERRLRAMRVLPPTAYAKQTTRLGGPDHNLSQIAADRELDVA